VIAHSTTVDAAPEAVWHALQDAATWEGIAGIEDIHDIRHAPDGLLEGFDFHTVAAGMRFEATATVVKRNPPTSLTLVLESKDMTARLAVRAKGDAAPVTLAVGVEFEGRSFVVRMALPAIERTLRAGLPREVDAFAARLAAGT
jgi:hypothetical protein